LTNDASVIAGNDLSARTWPSRTGTVGDEHMEAFGGADRVENLDTEALFETMEDAGGQGFAGGDGVAHAVQIEVGSVAHSWRRRGLPRLYFASPVRQQGNEIRGHGEKQSRPQALDDGVDARRRG